MLEIFIVITKWNLKFDQKGLHNTSAIIVKQLVVNKLVKQLF